MLPSVFLLSATSPTLDLQVRSPRLHRQTNAFCFRLLRSEASVVHPFRPSFHGPSFPYFQRTDSHVFVAPCSSSPSPGRCGFIRSSLPSPGQCGLHTLVALLVTAIRLRVGARPPLLVTAITGSVRPRYRCSPSPSHLLVAASRRQHSLGLTGTPTHFC